MTVFNVRQAADQYFMRATGEDREATEAVRIIRSNEEAEWLSQRLEANPGAAINVAARKPVGEGGTVWLTAEARS
jgi:hypothetical protein